MRSIPRLLVALLVVFPAVLSAQKTFEEKVTVTYVEIPVTVVGRDGVPLRGLTKANFEILDDGEKRPVESFDAIDFARRDEAKAVSPLHPASRRRVLLLFDLTFSTPLSVGRAQQAARDFIARGIGTRDLVAIGTVNVDQGFRYLTAFTTDRDLLLAAISDPRTFRSSDPLQIAGNNPFVSTDATSFGQPEGRGNSAAANEVAADFARGFGRADDAFHRGRIKTQLEMLGAVAQSLQRVAGRKHLVLLSEGFDARLIQGRVTGETNFQNEENEAIEKGELWKVDSDKRFGNSDAQKAIATMAEQFRRADVLLHAVDIQGLRVQNDIRGGSKVNSNDALFMLANAGGGSVLRNSNDIASEFDSLMRKEEVVYVLGFQAPVGRPGQFHQLRVKLVNVPNGRIRHRGGYYDAGNESGIERSLSTAEVILNDLETGDIGIDAFAAAFPGDGEKAQVPVVLEIKGSDLVKHAKGGSATTDVFVYAFDEEGVVRDSSYQRMRLDLKIVGERIAASGIRYYGTLALPPGHYAIKTLVRIGESDTKDFRRVDLDVPTPGDVAVVPPIFFADPGDWLMVREQNGEGKSYPFVLDGETFIPAPRAELRKGEPRLFTVFVYNADPDELSWEVEPKARLVSESRSDTVTKLVFALESVPPGVTDLGVTVRKKGSTDERKASTPIHFQ